MARRQLTKEQQERKAARIAKRIEDNRKKTIDKLIELMERDGLEYVREWSVANAGVNLFDPHNPITGTHYRGANLINLAVACITYGITDNRFTTISQAKKQGWTVREGAPTYMVEKCKKFTYQLKNDDGTPALDENSNEKWVSYVRPVSYWWVVNYSDIDGAPALPDSERPALPEYDTTSYLSITMDRLKETSRCEIRERVSDKACYSPTFDYVTFPKREQFSSPQAALRTLCHEMGHSTGHESALNRTFAGRFGSRDYAFEELIAELTSAFVCSQLGADVVPEDSDGDDGMQRRHENHAAYLKSWLSKFRSDTTYLFRAATKASAAADFIMDRLVKQYPEYAITPDDTTQAA